MIQFNYDTLKYYNNLFCGVFMVGLYKDFDRNKNIGGRDFVIGDIHGDLTGLNSNLLRIGFNKSIDRLFCTGDLVDRGMNSYDVLMLSKDSDWFYPLMGNHEWFVCLNFDKNRKRWFNDPDVNLSFGNRDGREFHLWHKSQGGGWLESLTFDELVNVRGVVQNMPIGASVVTPSGRLVGLVHAEPTSDWNTLKSILRNCTLTDLLLENEKSVGVPSILQSRNRVKRFAGGDIDESGFIIENIDKVYVGHTITYSYFDVEVGESVSVGNIQYMDGGSWYNLGADYPIIELI